MTERPTLLFDGDCGICRRWVAYWRMLTEERVVYRPYQEAAADFPTLAEQDLARAIFLVEPDGEIFSGAAATFRLLRMAEAKPIGGRSIDRCPASRRSPNWPTAFFRATAACLPRSPPSSGAQSSNPSAWTLRAFSFFASSARFFSAPLSRLPCRSSALSAIKDCCRPRPISPPRIKAGEPPPIFVCRLSSGSMPAMPRCSAPPSWARSAARSCSSIASCGRR